MTKLTEADNKFIRDFLNVTDDDFDARTVTCRNRFSGEPCETSPIVAKMVKFVFDVEFAFENAPLLKQISKNLTVGNAIQKFDRARMLVLKMDSNAYMCLLD